MLKVGIHENVAFSSKINDKGTLVIVAQKKQTEEDEEAALMALLGQSDGSIETATDDNGSQNFLIFPIQLKGYENKELVEVRSAAALVKEASNLRAFLSYILSQYTTQDNIEWDLFRDSDYTLESLKPAVIRSQEYLDVVYRNLVTQFNDQMAVYGDPDKLFRVVLVRTSKKSHYPKLRNLYLDKQPFMEPMEIPVEESKIGFTDSEKTAGLDNPDPLVEGQSAEDKDTSSLGDAGL